MRQVYGRVAVLLLFLIWINLSYANNNQRGIAGVPKNNVSTDSDINTTILPPNIVPSNPNAAYASTNINPNDLSKPIETLDTIVAFVNNDVITADQVQNKIEEVINTFKRSGSIQPKSSDLRIQVLNQLILQTIQLDLASKAGITSTTTEVNNTINNIMLQNNLTPDKFKIALQQQGLTLAQFRIQVAIQMRIDKLKQSEVDSHASVNEKAIDFIFKSKAYKQRVDYNLSDIVISIPTHATQAVLQQQSALAQSAYRELQSGVPFNVVSAKYSTAPNALSGGNVGWRSNVTMPTQILNILSKLSVGGYTNIVTLPNGYFIFTINDIRQSGSVQMVKQYHVRHILIKISDDINSAEAYQRITILKHILEKYNNNPTQQNIIFNQVAQDYSQDTSSIHGGDLGWVSGGDTVPQFDQVMQKIAIGTISQPIQSQFGWHILEVLGIRETNLTLQRERAAIANEIHDDQLNTLYAQWLHDIRAAAYVKFNDNN